MAARHGFLAGEPAAGSLHLGGWRVEVLPQAGLPRRANVARLAAQQGLCRRPAYSSVTVTDLARLRGWSTL
jgi:hypothetical protein